MFRKKFPLFEEGTPEEFLHFLQGFNDRSRKVGYTTGPLRHNGFEQLSTGNSLNDWTTLKQNIRPGEDTLIDFNNILEQFKVIQINDPSCVEAQKAYMRTVKKLRELTISQFVDRLNYMNPLIQELPGSDGTSKFSDNQLKDILYQAVIRRWKSNFVNSGATIHRTNPDQLKLYLVLQEKLTDNYNPEKKKKNHKGNNNDNRKDNRHNNSSSNKKKKPHNYNNKDDKKTVITITTNLKRRTKRG